MQIWKKATESDRFESGFQIRHMPSTYQTCCQSEYLKNKNTSNTSTSDILERTTSRNT